jgi:hypothetical protein
MSANTALITDAAKTAARQTLSDYSAGVFAHTTGDWTQHNVVRVYDQVFNDQAGHTDTVKTLRVLLTSGSSDIAIALPANPTGADVLITSPPLITVQPASRAFSLGTTGRFSVGAISDTALTYQWYKAGAIMAGQTTSQLVIPNVGVTDVAAYTVVVTNANGSTTSNPAELSISVGHGGHESDGGFDPLDIVFAPFSFF